MNLKKSTLIAIFLLSIIGCLLYITLKSDTKVIIKQLETASPEQVIRYFFDGYTNHNLDVIMATQYYPIKSDYKHPDINKWEVLEITEIDSSLNLFWKESTIRKELESFYAVCFFKVKHQITLKDGYHIEKGNTNLIEGTKTWHFILIKKTSDSRWKIYSYGN